MYASRFILLSLDHQLTMRPSGVHLIIRMGARMPVNPPDGRLEVNDRCLPHTHCTANTNAITQVLSRL